ncbi:hypothetical protein BD410DRAFT_807648 [Rickenella mellea]|uniref:Uncharacterized protein n=1 Tax=Rickenella mellea TaxID=50990 RepID=A0A4Y7PR52_9AGAM|nr:hypothetical protein BD410DRAFT_807648 [Rickenella mellea]
MKVRRMVRSRLIDLNIVPEYLCALQAFALDVAAGVKRGQIMTVLRNVDDSSVVEKPKNWSKSVFGDACYKSNGTQSPAMVSEPIRQRITSGLCSPQRASMGATSMYVVSWTNLGNRLSDVVREVIATRFSVPGPQYYIATPPKIPYLLSPRFTEMKTAQPPSQISPHDSPAVYTFTRRQCNDKGTIETILSSTAVRRWRHVDCQFEIDEM